jgi:hypothetical protein
MLICIDNSKIPVIFDSSNQNKKEMNPVKMATELSDELISRGISGNFSISDTDYGCSCYFTFYKSSESLEKLKVRVSDHSVQNTSRCFDEYHVHEGNFNSKRIANTIEIYLFPERFTFVECSMKEGATHRINGIFGKYERK